MAKQKTKGKMRKGLSVGEKTLMDGFIDYWKGQAVLPTLSNIRALGIGMGEVDDAPRRSFMAVRGMVSRRLKKLKVTNAIKGAIAEL